MPVAVNGSSVAVNTWLDAEIADVEARLSDHPPTCTLDRQGAASPGLKELEGRYALLRRARKSIKAGGELSELDHEVNKAEQIARASRGANPPWIGYARGVAAARDDVCGRIADPPRDANTADPS